MWDETGGFDLGPLPYPDPVPTGPGVANPAAQDWSTVLARGFVDTAQLYLMQRQPGVGTQTQQRRAQTGRALPAAPGQYQPGAFGGMNDTAQRGDLGPLLLIGGAAVLAFVLLRK